jgi:phage repressor protein C with HTH and peptisase S24 domain
MKPASFAKYLDGNRRPGAVVLEKISRLGVNVDWLLTGEGAMLDRLSQVSGSMSAVRDKAATRNARTDGAGEESRQDGSDSRFHRVPLVRIREDSDEGLRLVETGQGEWVDGTTIRQMYGVEPALLRDFRVTGDSMNGSIEPGDRVRAVLWDCRSPNDGTVCLLRGPVALLVRRVRLKGPEVLLVADNSDVPDRTVTQDQWENDYQGIARILEVRRPI